MAVPIPHKSETKEQFQDRCMGDENLVNEYPDTKQRFAICESQWDNREGKK